MRIQNLLKKFSAMLIALAMTVSGLGTSVMPVFAASEDLKSVVVDDRDAAFEFQSGDGKSGGWAQGSLGLDGAAGTEHWSNAVSATAVLTFTGTGVELYGPKKPNHRIITVQIDDGEVLDADCYAASDNMDALIFSSMDAGIELENTEHTLKITTTDRANEAASSATGVSITYAKVYSPEDGEPVIIATTIDDTEDAWDFQGGDANNGGWTGGGSGAASSTEHWSNGAGSVAELHFTGSKLELYGIKAPNHRFLSVAIDGGEAIEVDCYAAERTGSVLLYSSEESGVVLENARHTAVITTLDKTNDSVSGSTIGVSITHAIAYGEPIPAPVLTAYVGDEKLLDLPESYARLAEGTGPEWSGVAWKNDEIASKVIAAAGDEDLTNVQVTASDFATEEGTVYAKENVKISWLGETTARQSRNNNSASANRSALKTYPDIITGNADPISVSKNTVRFAWLTLQVPADQAAGVYKGTVTISADQLETPIELDYTLEVLDLMQPAADNFELQLWQHPYSVANYYLGLGSSVTLGKTCSETQDDFYFTEDHFKLMRSEMEAYAAAGGHDAVANIVPEAWNHQSFYGDPTMIEWTKKADGSWTFDYTDYDLWINFLIECGVINPAEGLGKIKCYSIVPWNNQIGYFDEASNQTVKKSLTVGSAEWTEIWTAFLTDFLKHSDEKGWTGVTYIAMDERGISDVEKAAKLIRSVTNEQGVHFHTSSCLNYEASNNTAVSDLVDDISINQGYTDQRDQIKTLTAHRRELGLTTTIYTCVGDFPGSFMMSDPGDNYWTILNAYALGADGYLKWAFDNYLYDMYGDASYRYWEPGDGWFIYPEQRDGWSQGKEAGFYSTPRFEMLKQGARDAEKMRWLLEEGNLDEDKQAVLENALNAMSRPSSTTTNGAITYANAEQRARVHSQTKAVSDAIEECARAVKKAVPADRTALQAAIARAEAVAKDDYTAASAAAMEQALAAAKEADNDSVTQAAADEAAKALNDAIDALVAKFTVVFKNGDIVLKTEKVEPHAAATAPEAPEKEGFVFVRWDQDFSDVTSNLTIQAVFEEEQPPVSLDALRQAVASAKAVEGKYTKASKDALDAAVAAGEAVLADPAATQAAADAAKEAIDQAVNGLVRVWTVVFKNGDVVVKTEEVADKGSATAPAAPEKEGYVFKEWSADFTNVTSDLTIEAVFEVKQPEVSLDALREAVASAKAIEGKYTKASKDALDAAVAAGEAVLADPAATQAAADAAKEAIDQAADGLVRVWTVVFKNGDVVVKTEEVADKGSATAPETPEKEGYVFKEWSADYTNVTSDLTIEAVFEAKQPEVSLDELRQAAEDAKELDGPFTEDSRKALDEAIAAAEAALENPNVTQEEADEALDALEQAVADLEVAIYRIYNANNGEHLFTVDEREYHYLSSIGWTEEGIAWYAPASGREMVRMYNPNSGEHHYTSDPKEISYLETLKWENEGVKWYSASKENGVPIHRLYNPNAGTDEKTAAGAHHYTLEDREKDYLSNAGWNWEHNEPAQIFAKRAAK